MMRSGTSLRWSSALVALAACGGSEGGRVDAAVVDAAVVDAAIDGAAIDGAAIDGAAIDVGLTDAVSMDATEIDAAAIDAAMIDAAVIDAAVIDAAVIDAAAIDAIAVDAASPDAASPDAAGPPCTNGPGRALWRLSWPAGQGGYARVDAWGAACAYSLADPACSLSGEPHNYASFGPASSSTAPPTTSASATASRPGLHRGDPLPGRPRRRLRTAALAGAVAAPRRVSVPATVPISTHRLYTLDWTPYLAPGDAPGLTAVTLRPMPTGVAVSQLELCVQ
jgi:hypothetical protein